MLPAVSPTVDPKRLYAKLARVRFRRRLTSVVSGSLAVAAILVGGAAAACWIDWLLPLPSVIRAVCLVAILSLAGIAFFSLLVGRLRRNSDNLKLALELERSNPRLHDVLGSAVEFLERPQDESVSSPLFQKIAIRQAVRLSDHLDFGSLISYRPIWFAAIGSLVAVALSLPAVAFAPHRVGTALKRLLLPFGEATWPQKTEIRVLAPERFPYKLALGDAFELRADVIGAVPDRATFHFWLEGTPVNETAWSITKDESGASGSLVVRVEPSRATRNFKVRVTANDADSGWQEVEVLPPPELVPRDGRPSPQFDLEYPSYTGLPPRRVPDGASKFETVAGTVVTMRAATNRPVSRCYIVLRSESPAIPVTAFLAPLGAGSPLGSVWANAAAETVWKPTPVNVGPDGRMLDVTWMPRVTGDYWLRFEDESGFGTTRQIDIRVNPDPAPTVTLDRPNQSQDSFEVTPTAVMPLQSNVSDLNYGIRSVWMEYRLGKEEPRRRSYHDSRTMGLAVPSVAGGLSNVAESRFRSMRTRPPEVRINQSLVLTSFRHVDGSELQPGDTLTVQFFADDFDEVWFDKSPGASHLIELKIVSAAAVEAKLNREETDVRQSLLKLQQWQQEAREKAVQAEQNRTPDGKVRPEDLEKIVQAEQLQQQIRSRIGDEKDGLRSAVNRIRQTQKDNQLTQSASRDRMEAIGQELDRLAREELPSIEPLLNAARDTGDYGPKKNDANQPDPLAEATRRQKSVEQAITEMLRRMEPWSGANELRGQARQALNEQDQLNNQTEQLDRKFAGEQASGMDRPRLTEQQREELDRTAAKQEALANQMKELLDKLDRVAKDKLRQERDRLSEAQKLDDQAAERDRLSEQAETPEEKADLKSEAQRLRSEAQEQRDAANDLKKEAQALMDAAQAGREGAKPEDGANQTKLDESAKQASKNIRENRLGDAKQNQQQTRKTLEKILDSLEERRQDDLDRLQKKLKEAQERLDDLADRQERLQKKVKDAQKIADPAERQKELERLAREQEKLKQEAKELAQELSRLKAGEAGQTMNRASREMTEAGQQLSRGQNAEQQQNDVVEQLDKAQDEVEKARERIEEELMRERLAKVADRIKGLRDRQEAAIAETKRLDNVAGKAMKWERSVRASLSNHAQNQESMSAELNGLIESKFRTTKIIAKMMEQCTEAMTLSRDAVRDQLKDVNDRPGSEPEYDAEFDENQRKTILRWQELALRRLDQFLEAINPDKDMKPPSEDGPKDGGGPMGGGGGESDAIPLLAQLKALRSLQAEINSMTERFALDHPDPMKHTDPDKAELTRLRKMQKDIAELIQEYSASEEKGAQP